MSRRILVVDDNQGIHEDFRRILAELPSRAPLDDIETELFGAGADAEPRERYEIDSALQGKDAAQMLRDQLARDESYALAFVDMRMPPGWDGLTTIENLWMLDPELQVVICTAHSDQSWSEIAQRLKRTDRLLILKKPFDAIEVSQLASSLTEKRHLARRANLRTQELEDLVKERTQWLEFTNAGLRQEVERREALEASLGASEARYALAAAGANDGLWDWDLEQDGVYYSSRWKAMLGYSDEAIGDEPREWFDRVHPADRAALDVAVRSHLEGRSDFLSSEYRMLHRDGEYRWMLTRGLAVRNAEGRAVRAAGSQSDVTERRLAAEQLKHDAFHDSLTGLPNRALLTDRLRQCLLLSRRRSERYAVLSLDLDRFKTVNDSLGHQIGDRLLVNVAAKIERSVRASDSAGVPSSHSVARTGGDEFLVLLRDLRSEDDALRVAERIQATLAIQSSIATEQLAVSVSIGIAFGSPSYEDPDDVIRDAEIALHHAKAKGRGSSEVFSAHMHVAAMKRWRTEKELTEAITRQEVFAVYQPIIDVKSRRVEGLESLMRWKHPVKGLIPPGEFIPIAEDAGLIVSMGAWILREACCQLDRCRDRFGSSRPFAISVNVSGKQLSRTQFVDETLVILHETGAEPHEICLEITESTLLEGGNWRQSVEALRELGMRLHLDDFGTGYSSLSYLSRTKIDAIKIDRSFIGSMSTDPKNAAIVHAIVAMAHELGMQVVAEGVETKEQLEELDRLGVDMAQGYYICRPGPLEEIVERMAVDSCPR